MTRDEALILFRERQVKSVGNQILLELESAYQKQKDALAPGFQESFISACKEIRLAQENGKMAELHFLVLTMLRTRLNEQDYSFVYKACNDWWLLDSDHFDAGTYDASFVFDYYNKMRALLMKEKNIYVGKLAPQDVDIIMQEEASKFMQYVGRIAKYRILELTSGEEFQSINRSAMFQIQVGEYLDYAENIYTENAEKDYDLLVRRIYQKKREDLCFEDLQGLTLPDKDLSESDLRFSNLRDGTLTGANFRYGTLIGTIFESCDLRGADFSFGLLNEAIFRNSNLENANFHKIEAYSGLENPVYWDTVGYFGVDFRGANLKGSNFLGADIRGARFDGAVLDGVVFTAEQINYLDLSESQSRGIKVVR